MVEIPATGPPWREFELFVYGKTKLIEKIVDSLDVKILYKKNGSIITDPSFDPSITKPSSHIHLTRISSKNEKLVSKIAYEIRDPKLEDLYSEYLEKYDNFRLLRRSGRAEYEVMDGQPLPTEEYIQKILGKKVVKTEYFSDTHWTEKELKLSRNSTIIPLMFMRKELKVKDIRSSRYRYKGYRIFEGGVGELTYRTSHRYLMKAIGKVVNHGKVFFLQLQDVQRIIDMFGEHVILNEDWYICGKVHSYLKGLRTPIFQILVSHETGTAITNSLDITPVSDFLHLKDALVMALFRENPVFKVDGSPVEVHSHVVHDPLTLPSKIMTLPTV